MELCIYGNPVLRRPADKIPVDEIPSYAATADEMYRIMYASKGIGLAAQQAGLTVQIIVIDTRESVDEKLVLINPEIISSSKKLVSFEEGCLSFPDIRADILRPQQVEVSFYDLKGKQHNKSFDGIMARAAQHEIDHLNGILFIDRMTPVQKLLLRKKILKLKLFQGKRGI